MSKQRISYIPIEDMDEKMQAEMHRCAAEGTPRPESSAIRAHNPASFWFFADSWNNIFRNGVCDHSLKELCRLYVSRCVKCEFCGNQRSMKAPTAGASNEDHISDILDFEKSDKYNARQKAVLSYAEAIIFRTDTDDAFWARLNEHFNEEELVEVGCMIGLTLGQQSWLRMLNIEHHQVLAGTSASMAPGHEDTGSLKDTKSQESYWAGSS